MMELEIVHRQVKLWRTFDTNIYDFYTVCHWLQISPLVELASAPDPDFKVFLSLDNTFDPDDLELSSTPQPSTKQLKGGESDIVEILLDISVVSV